MFGEIKAALIVFISAQNLPGLNNSYIYNYEPTQPSGFPALSVTASDRTGKFADTERNRTDNTFRIRVYMERQTVGTQAANLSSQSEAERVITALVDQLTSIFDNYPNYNLNNTVPNLVFIPVVPVKFGYAQAPSKDMRIADIMVTTTVVQ